MDRGGRETDHRYFCGLEKRQYVNKNIAKISNTEEEIITNQEDILEEVKSFFINLYENKDSCLEDVGLTKSSMGMISQN